METLGGHTSQVCNSPGWKAVEIKQYIEEVLRKVRKDGMKIKKATLTLALALAVVLGMVVGANAVDTLKTITASLNYGITIKYNGNVQEMKDANGNRVYPISYEGTTYLPVRAVANMLGIEVNWDDPTQTVWLGEGFVPTPVEQTVNTSDTSSSDTSYTSSGGTLDQSKYPAGTVITAKGKSYTSLGEFSCNWVVCTNSHGQRVLVHPETGATMMCVGDQNVDLGDGGQSLVESGQLIFPDDNGPGSFYG